MHRRLTHRSVVRVIPVTGRPVALTATPDVFPIGVGLGHGLSPWVSVKRRSHQKGGNQVIYTELGKSEQCLGVEESDMDYVTSNYWLRPPPPGQW